MAPKAIPKDPVVAVWVGLMRAHTAVLAAVEVEAKSAGFPPLEWYDLLWELERSPDAALRPFELEGRLLIAQYNLSRLIDRVSRAGYVTKLRCPEDGRGQVLVITEEGKELRARMWQVLSPAIQRHVGGHLSETEAVQLSELLHRFTDVAPGHGSCGDAGEGPAEADLAGGKAMEFA